MSQSRTIINSLEEAKEAINAMILFTMGNEHMSVIQGMYDISPKINIHAVNEIFINELNDSILPETRNIDSNLSIGGSHIGRDLVITLTRR
ncbi:hypothetical protein PFH44_15810 [Raoultella sp. Ech2A]|uniref:hypothetical protein n=1 Tax=Raoultella sp. Ech2A TaxID=2996539 RepID=UPI0024BF3012|nr:hypothetical protein [Raoultella sp. Ech2A]MDJ1654938.1 hypothetical protein [Raoultella sp. Ech2A]